VPANYDESELASAGTSSALSGVHGAVAPRVGRRLHRKDNRDMTALSYAIGIFLLTYGFLYGCDRLGGWLEQRFPSLAYRRPLRDQ
jgi:hypothetical protein